jgi:hypothetical protein
VQSPENMSPNTYANPNGMVNPSANNPNMSAAPYVQPNMNMAEMLPNNMAYPEIFYKIQPYVLMACDQMDTYGTLMPSQKMIEQISDNIYENACKTHPDLAEYARNNEANPNEDPEVAEVISRRGGGGRPHFPPFRPRRGGAVGDLIDILLISEFFRRRRRYY